MDPKHINTFQEEATIPFLIIAKLTYKIHQIHLNH